MLDIKYINYNHDRKTMGDNVMYDLDSLDFKILKIIQEKPKLPCSSIAKQLNVPKSTIHYRIKRLESLGIIRGYRAILNAEALGVQYTTITLVRGKYGRNYHKKIGTFLAMLPYVQSVYYVLGDIDFVILAKSPSREKYLQLLETLISSPLIERTSTMVVIKIVKEDTKILIES